ncbi:hypothetical protein KEC56_08665 [Microbacterium sp. YMB-B2]|uniref:Uncharacterized protein n=1 Tax=Microbacterium tenebrionis TaxID=2830665 RepID=A0A9X1LQ14_9MICO|nr:hypothetical protein [Microbacterium tenebrionis]MCC2029588.1 hypothetical protein [Microbacterium tenebrionis]
MTHRRSRTCRIAAAAIAWGLVGGGVTVAPAAGADAVPVVGTDLLADATSGQQRWLSVPDSRIVLNPFDFDGSGSELDQAAGSALPLHLGYYANDKAPERRPCG